MRARNEEGAGLVEYMLLVVLIAVVALIAIVFAGSEVSEMWSQTGSSLDTARAPAQLVVALPGTAQGLCQNGGGPPAFTGVTAPPPAANC